MGTFLSSLPNTVIPKLCSAKLSPIWGMTPMPQGPLWAASGFGGSGFFAAGLAGLVGEGFVGDDLAGAGLGAAVGAVCARAGCASASASHKATLRITSRSAVSTRLDQQNCNRESVRVNRARAPNDNTSVRGCALRAFSRDSRRSLRWSESGRSPSLSTPIGRQREFRRRRRPTAAGSIAPRVAA